MHAEEIQARDNATVSWIDLPENVAKIGPPSMTHRLALEVEEGVQQILVVPVQTVVVQRPREREGGVVHCRHYCLELELVALQPCLLQQEAVVVLGPASTQASLGARHVHVQHLPAS